MPIGRQTKLRGAICEVGFGRQAVAGVRVESPEFPTCGMGAGVPVPSASGIGAGVPGVSTLGIGAGPAAAPSAFPEPTSEP